MDNLCVIIIIWIMIIIIVVVVVVMCIFLPCHQVVTSEVVSPLILFYSLFSLLNLAFAFVFILYNSTFVLVGELNVCFCCVRFCFSISSQEVGLGNVSEMTYFVLTAT